MVSIIYRSNADGSVNVIAHSSEIPSNQRGEVLLGTVRPALRGRVIRPADVQAVLDADANRITITVLKRQDRRAQRVREQEAVAA
jgi:hypothetical protein